MAIPNDVAERAYKRFTLADNGCHVSVYSIGSHGYAQVGWMNNRDGRGMTTAHRAAWTHIHGQIPGSMTVDHICKNRRCVNVDHLRLLSTFENGRRNHGRDWPLGQCINGHPNSELVERRHGGRIMKNCRICTAESRARWARQNPDKVRAAQRRYEAKRRRHKSGS